MRRCLLLFCLIFLFGCGSYDRSEEGEKEFAVEGLQFLGRQVFNFEAVSKGYCDKYTVAVSIFTSCPVNTEQARAAFEFYSDPESVVTVFFYDDKFNVLDDNWYAYTDGSFLYYRGEKYGVKLN